MISDLVINKARLISLIEENKESVFIKKRIHYNSLINITNILINEKNKKRPHNLISLLNDYYQLIFSNNLKFNKLESLMNYKNYILPCGSYMILNYDFLSMYNLWRFILLGLFLDILKFSFYGNNSFLNIFPFITMFSFFTGLYVRFRAKKKGKYFAYKW